MKKIKVNEREYEVTPMPPFLMPAMTFFDNTAMKNSSNMDEVAKNMEDVKQVMEKVFAQCVKPPTVVPEDALEVFRSVVNYTGQVIDRVNKQFFPEKQPPTPPGSRDRNPDT